MESFQRSIESELLQWKSSPERKPLVLRGARQTGKTTVIKRFSKNFRQFIHLNMERFEDRIIFEKEQSFGNLMDELFFTYNADKNEETLIFIDEIQKSTPAVSTLRYFYEDYPQWHVVAAGSLLENSLDFKAAFPVGRVNYLYLHPVSFSEFLFATGETRSLEALNSIPVPEYAHDKLLQLFHRYVLIGGMPEAVRIYRDTNDLSRVVKVYDDLMSSFFEDIEKYDQSPARRNVINHVFKTIFLNPSERITYNGYGFSSYGSTMVKEAFNTLEKAMLCTLVHPLSSTEYPLQPNLRKKPRLHLLDTGLCSYRLGIQKEILGIEDLTKISRGNIAEHIVGQELAATESERNENIFFWVRDKNQSSAEVDYILPYENRLIPIEVKSGKTGTLRSLMQYMENSEEKSAVRLYSGKHTIDTVSCRSGKKFRLINIPYYQASQIKKYLML